MGSLLLESFESHQFHKFGTLLDYLLISDKSSTRYWICLNWATSAVCTDDNIECSENIQKLISSLKYDKFLKGKDKNRRIIPPGLNKEYLLRCEKIIDFNMLLRNKPYTADLFLYNEYEESRKGINYFFPAKMPINIEDGITYPILKKITSKIKKESDVQILLDVKNIEHKLNKSYIGLLTEYLNELYNNCITEVGEYLKGISKHFNGFTLLQEYHDFLSENVINSFKYQLESLKRLIDFDSGLPEEKRFDDGYRQNGVIVSINSDKAMGMGVGSSNIYDIIFNMNVRVLSHYDEYDYDWESVFECTQNMITLMNFINGQYITTYDSGYITNRNTILNVVSNRIYPAPTLLSIERLKKEIQGKKGIELNMFFGLNDDESYSLTITHKKNLQPGELRYSIYSIVGDTCLKITRVILNGIKVEAYTWLEVTRYKNYWNGFLLWIVDIFACNEDNIFSTEKGKESYMIDYPPKPDTSLKYTPLEYTIGRENRLMNLFGEDIMKICFINYMDKFLLKEKKDSRV